jgi:hypothetical protein
MSMKRTIDDMRREVDRLTERGALYELAGCREEARAHVTAASTLRRAVEALEGLNR